MAVAAWFGPNFNERTTTPVRFGARAWTLSHDGEGLNLERGKICAGRGNRRVEVLGGLWTVETRERKNGGGSDAASMWRRGGGGPDARCTECSRQLRASGRGGNGRVAHG
jgi:hypothetical protein